MIPCYSGWEPFSPIIPTLYYDVQSVEQRTKAICLAIETLEQYADLVSAELNKHSGEIKALQTEDVRLLNLINNNWDNLYGYIKEIQNTLAGMAEGAELTWNYTLSRYQDSKDAIRSMRNDQNTIHGFTVAETACYTVAEMADSKLTARGWALISRDVMKPYKLPSDLYVGTCNCCN